MNLARLRAFFFPERSALRLPPFAVIGAAGTLVGLAVALSAAGSRIDWSLYDIFSRRLAAGGAPAPGLVVVAIDEPSVIEIGQPWPWPRSLHAALVDRLVQGGARTIAFDLLFDLPAVNQQDDEVFADAIRRSGRTVLATDQAVIEDRGYTLTQWTDPLPALMEGAAAIGVVRIPYDPDSVLRRSVFSVDGRPSFAAVIASREPGVQFEDDDGEARLIRFNGPPRHGVLTVSYYQALDPAALPADVFRGRHVLIGRSLAAPTTVDEEPDHFTTPVAPRLAGVEIHATIVDALLRGRFIAEPLADRYAVIAAALGLSAVATAVSFFLAPGSGLVSAAGIALAWVAASYVLLANGVRLPVVVPLFAALGSYVATATYRFALLRRERRLIKRAFQHYVSPAIVDEMLADPSRLKLGGTEYEVTVLFSDLEGFTTLGEHLAPAALSAHLGEYFKAMLDVLLPEHGTLDKLIGDAIMMYFGCPLPDDRHAVQACRGALAMQRQMIALNARWTAAGLPPLRTRIGINTGRAVAGNMGTDTIFNYTILGDAVNLASRLEGINKAYGTLIIVGDDTWHRVQHAFEGRELDSIRVKGKSNPVAIHELIAEKGAIDSAQRELCVRYARALEHYRRGLWTDALGGFDAVLELKPDDGPSRTLRARCEAQAANPPVTWDGVYTMTEK